MGFSSEIKDFIAGFKAGQGFWDARERRAASAQRRENTRQPTEDEISRQPGIPVNDGELPRTSSNSPGASPAKGEIAWGEAAPEQRALLNTIAGPESAGQYNVIYGGQKFDDYSKHPGQYVTITSGPNKGQKSSAAGKYQFLESTWNDIASRHNLPDFSPENQDKAAWLLASENYGRIAGRSLTNDLKSGDAATLENIGKTLRGTWTSLPGGIEQGQDANTFVSTYNNYLQSGGGQVASAPSPQPQQADNTPFEENEDYGDTGEEEDEDMAFSSPRGEAIPVEEIAMDQLIPAGAPRVEDENYGAQPALFAATGGAIPEPDKYNPGRDITVIPSNKPTSGFVPRRVGDPGPMPTTAPGARTASQMKFDAARAAQAVPPVAPAPAAQTPGKYPTVTGFTEDQLSALTTDQLKSFANSPNDASRGQPWEVEGGRQLHNISMKQLPLRRQYTTQQLGELQNYALARMRDEGIDFMPLGKRNVRAGAHSMAFERGGMVDPNYWEEAMENANDPKTTSKGDRLPEGKVGKSQREPEKLEVQRKREAEEAEATKPTWADKKPIGTGYTGRRAELLRPAPETNPAMVGPNTNTPAMSGAAIPDDSGRDIEDRQFAGTPPADPVTPSSAPTPPARPAPVDSAAAPLAGNRGAHSTQPTRTAIPEAGSAPARAHPQQGQRERGESLVPSGNQRMKLRPKPKLLQDVNSGVHGGLMFLQEVFGLGGPREGVPTPQGANQTDQGIRRMASGEGRATPEEIKQIDDIVDPDRRMSEGDRQMERMAKMTQWYLSRGRKRDAQATAGSLLLYAADRFSKLGSAAAAGLRAYEQSGDPADLERTTQYLEQAYQLIPDGGSFDLSLDQSGKWVNATRTGPDGEKKVFKVDSSILPELVQGAMDKSLYWREVMALGNPQRAAALNNRENAAINRAGQEQATIRREGRSEERQIRKEGRAEGTQLRKEERAQMRKDDDRRYTRGENDRQRGENDKAIKGRMDYQDQLTRKRKADEERALMGEEAGPPAKYPNARFDRNLGVWLDKNQDGKFVPVE